MRTIQKKDIEAIIVPCPRCKSWDTEALDSKHEMWLCQHVNCRTPFELKNNYALVFLKSGEVVRVDRGHKAKVV